MAPEEFCARVLGRFLRCALAAPASGCMVVDYEDPNERKTSLFGIPLPRAPRKLEAVFGYAKDPEQRRRFEDDRKAKQALITPEVRAAASRWAMPVYRDLRAR